VSKVIWQKAVLPTCHPSWLRINSSDVDHHLIMVSWTHVSQPAKQYLDSFSRFCKVVKHICVTNAQSDRHTDHVMSDICSKRPHLCMHCVHAIQPKTGQFTTNSKGTVIALNGNNHFSRNPPILLIIR